MRSKANPFAQAKQYWKVSFVLPEAVAMEAENAFNDIAQAVLAFEADDDGTIWTYELIYDVPPDVEEVRRRVMVLAALGQMESPEIICEPVIQQDWQTQLAKDFPPLDVGRFYIHGSHVELRYAPHKIAIQVDAGEAFGSGEHGTTMGCLQAMEYVAKRGQCVRVLDMGCGSGILAIAAAKLWKTRVLAVDVDPVAVMVTDKNIKANRVTNRVSASVSDGYASDKVKRAAPYDLIVANILARPLVQFSPDLARYLAPGGMAILSGLLRDQEAYVRGAHQAQGLAFIRRWQHGDWVALLMKKA